MSGKKKAKKKATSTSDQSDPNLRTLTVEQDYLYRLALMREDLIVKKKEIIDLQRQMAEKDEEIIKVQKENIELKSAALLVEESNLYHENKTILADIGLKDGEQVIRSDGRLHIAPAGTVKGPEKRG